jgi:hypothetical protein
MTGTIEKHVNQFMSKKEGIPYSPEMGRISK